MPASTDVPCPVPPDQDLRPVEDALLQLHRVAPFSLAAVTATATALSLSIADLALYLETLALRERDGPQLTPGAVWAEGCHKYQAVMRRAVRRGVEGLNATSFLSGDWARRLPLMSPLLGLGWSALRYAIAVQEFNAGMGLVSAAPTGGAAGTVPGSLIAVGEGLDLPVERQVQALFVAGLVGRAAFGRGPVSGAQAGCGGEIGVAAAMAAGGVAHLLGGGFGEVDAAAALAATPFVGLECSPAYGLVEYPCVPRNGFAALTAVAAAEMAMAGLVPPHGADDTLDRIFAVGRLLPAALRETNSGPWAAPACTAGACLGCTTRH